MRGGSVALAAVLATCAFIAYALTLLPGVDLGDTGGLQAAILWPTTSARQAYPLYFGLARPFVQLLSASNPALGANLFSAVAGALAVGLLGWLVATVTASRVGGAVAALLLASSYTFWTQAVIAEVYTLHLVLVGVILIALRFWERHPTHPRLALVCATYALAFGNHLATILLFLPLAAFLLMVTPRPSDLLRRRVAFAGLAIAAVGALQYLPNLLALWSTIDAPSSWSARLAAFWFDVTKSDWRATMVLGVPRENGIDRLAMWRWDALQQFGYPGLGLAALGGLALWRISRPWAVLVAVGYLVHTLFALTYNVGDTHVFLLPGHFFTAFAAGAGAAALMHLATRPTSRMRRLRHWPAGAVATMMLILVVWRGWLTFPAVDRHADHRGTAFTQRLFQGLTARDALLVSRMTWDQENAVLYAGRNVEPPVAWTRLQDVMLHFPFLVRDNLAIGRDVVLTAGAAAQVVAAYGSAFSIIEDPVAGAGSLADVAARIPRGSPYVITILTPPAAFPLDEEDLAAALTILGATRNRSGLVRTDQAYQVFAGAAGETGAEYHASNRPFVRDVSAAGDLFTIRMDAWLPSDTFRRGGFGHVLHGRTRLLFIERGVSLVWLDTSGTARVMYAAGPYAPERRFRISANATRLASRRDAHDRST